MKRLILLLLLLCIEAINGQNNNEQSFIIIEPNRYNDLYLFDKDNDKAKIKVIYYDIRKEGFNNNKRNSKNDIIKVKPKPNSNFYEFNSKFPPKIINSISGLKIYSIEDVSKNNKEIFQNNQSSFYFLEQVSCEKYSLWEMRLKIKE